MKHMALFTLFSLFISFTAYSQLPEKNKPQLINCTENITVTTYSELNEDYLTAPANGITHSDSQICFSYIEDYETGRILNYEIKAARERRIEKTLLSDLTFDNIRNYTTKIIDPVTKRERTLISTVITFEDRRPELYIDEFDSVEPADRLFLTFSFNGTHAEKDLIKSSKDAHFYMNVYKAKLVGINLKYLRTQDDKDSDQEPIYGIHD